MVEEAEITKFSHFFYGDTGLLQIFPVPMGDAFAILHLVVTAIRLCGKMPLKEVTGAVVVNQLEVAADGR